MGVASDCASPGVNSTVFHLSVGLDDLMPTSARMRLSVSNALSVIGALCLIPTSLNQKKDRPDKDRTMGDTSSFDSQ